MKSNVKKILYVVSTLRRSGPTKQLSYIIKYLDRNYFKPMVITLSNESEDSMIDYFQNNLNVEVETLGLSRINSLFVGTNKLKKIIREHNFDVLHTQGIRADFFSSNIRNVYRVATLRNYPYYDYVMTYGKAKGLLMARLHLYFLSKINKPVVVSESVSDMLYENNRIKMSFVRNGVDVKAIEGLGKKKSRKDLGIPQDAKVFISVGHLNSRKDPISIINAFRRAKSNNSFLLFLGNGKLKNKCVSLSKHDKNIFILGGKENVYDYLRMSDYFISASKAEGFPNTILEAMLCGIPCLLSDISPHLEIHKLNKEASCIFTLKDENSLVEKIRYIVKKDYDLMSKSAKDLIYSSLTAESMSLKYQSIYKKE